MHKTENSIAKTGLPAKTLTKYPLYCIVFSLQIRKIRITRGPRISLKTNFFLTYGDPLWKKGNDNATGPSKTGPKIQHLRNNATGRKPGYVSEMKDHHKTSDFKVPKRRKRCGCWVTVGTFIFLIFLF